jgi:hypothetical protein
MQIKSANQLIIEEGQAKTAKAQGDRAPELIAAQINSQKASAASAWASAQYYKSKRQQEEVTMGYDPFKDFAKVSFTGNAGGKVNLTKYPLGKEFTLGIDGQQAMIKSVARDEKGQIWVEALTGRDNKYTLDKKNRRASYGWRIVRDIPTFNAELGREVEVGNNIPAKQQAKMAKAIGTLYNLPVAAPAGGAARGGGGGVPLNEF